jgi:hypothetical protein
MAQFETRLFQQIRNIMAVSGDDPEVLTSCMRIIEIQERIDQKASGGHSNTSVLST